MTAAGVVTAKSETTHAAPINAWKVAHSYVVTGDTKRLRFSPMSFRGLTYGVEDVAQCIAGFNPAHAGPPPQKTCYCGFNAWDDDQVAMRYLEKQRLSQKVHAVAGPYSYPSSFVMLRVALFGTIVEGTLNAISVNKWGYRASRQRVLDVFIGKKCGYCDNEAVYLGALKGAEMTGDETPLSRRQLLALCSRHVKLAYDIITPDALEKRNNIKFHWGYPS